MKLFSKLFSKLFGGKAWRAAVLCTLGALAASLLPLLIPVHAFSQTQAPAAPSAAQVCQQSGGGQQIVQQALASTIMIAGEMLAYKNPLKPNDDLLSKLILPGFENKNPGKIDGTFGAEIKVGFGSGFIIKAEAGGEKKTTYSAVTNAHVVEGMQSLRVIFSDESFAPAQVVGIDAPSDIAVISFASDKTLVPVSLEKKAGAQNIPVGSPVYAIGAPLGLSFTVTRGILSYANRYVEYENPSAFYGPYLQIDAPINRGNSGGLLIDECGQAVGMPTFIVAGSRGNNVGLNFAIPIDVVASRAQRIMRGEKFRQGWIGVAVADYSPEVREQLGIDTLGGVFVQNVFIPSPAYDAGLRPGDFLQSINGNPIATRDEYSSVFSDISNAGAGAELQIGFRRLKKMGAKAGTNTGGMTSPTLVSLVSSPRPEPSELQTQNARMWPGMKTKPLSQNEKELYGIGDDEAAVVVLGVVPRAAAEAAGLKSGDIMYAINGKPLGSLYDYVRAFEDPSTEKKLGIMRRGIRKDYVLPAFSMPAQKITGNKQ